MARKVPVRVQSHPAECGAVCLGMVLEYHGVFETSATLRRLCAITRDGANIGQICNVAKSFGFSSEIHKKGLKALRSASLPLVIHWDFNHFVVLESINRSSASIIDPAVGRRKISIEAFSNHFTGVCVTIEPNSGVGHIARPSISAEFFKLLPDDVRRSIFATSALILPALLIFVFSFIFVAFQKVVYDYTVERGQIKWGLYLVPIAFFLVSFQYFVDFLLRDHRSRIAFNNILRVRKLYFFQLMDKPVSYFETHLAGELLQRANDMADFVRSWLNLFSQVGEQIVLAFFCLLILIQIQPALALVIISPTTAILLWSLLLRNRLQESAIRQSQEVGVYDTLVIQRMETFMRFYAAGVHRQLFLTFLPILTRVQAAQTEHSRRLILYNVAAQVVQKVGPPVTAFFGAYFIVQDRISYGDVVISSFLGVIFAESVGKISSNALEFHECAATAPRAIEVLLGSVKESEARDNVSSLPAQPALLVVRDAGFGFDGKNANLFDGVDLVVEAGETIGICGGSGEGKTTFLETLSGQRTLVKGQIWFGGQLLHDMMPCGFVFSEEDFLSGNLTFFMIDDQPLDLGRLAEVLSICEMKGRVGSTTDDFGVIRLEDQVLSRGEIQRLCLAQALYRSSSFVIIDEAFNHVSASQAKRIINRLKELSVTIIMATHRLDVLAQCDRVFELKDGKLYRLYESLESLQEHAISHD